MAALRRATQGPEAAYSIGSIEHEVSVLPYSVSHTDHPVPGAGAAVKVAPGVFWVRMPLPFALDHVNLWLLEDGDGWMIIDTGYADDEGRSRWETLFDTVMAPHPVTGILVTHFHPDHIGLADWLVERWRVPLRMSLSEWLQARALSGDRDPKLAAAALQFYRRTGLDGSLVEALTARGNTFARSVPAIPPILMRIRDDDRLIIGGHIWQVIVGGGHSPEHVCLYSADLNILIAGDLVLPKISPNVSVWPQEPGADPLGDFLRSLDRLEALPEDTLVLPSHGRPFRGLRDRIGALRQHHDERLAETLAACRVPRSAASMMKVMFPRPLDTHQLGFAIGEVVAHLNHLVARKALHIREREDGVLHYGIPAD